MAVVVAVAAGGALALAGRDEPSPPPAPPPPITELRVTAGPGEAEISPEERAQIAASEARARTWLASHRKVRSARVVAELTWSARDARALARAAAGTQTSIALNPRVDSIDLRLPVIKQAYRNNCETAALSMALRGAASQRTLQAALPQSLPLDPQQGARGMVWGDPNTGFVGRVEGGGFGVFEQPLARLGARYDAQTTAVRTARFNALLARVRAGHPVVAWTGLGPSAPWDWRTPAGREIRADRSQHTVVLAGVGPGGVTIHDPWTGTSSTVTATSLRAGWERLGRRAVITSAGTGALITNAAPAPQADGGGA